MPDDKAKLCFSRVTTSPYPKDENGKPLCRWCKGPVKPPKRTFCGPACVHEHSIRANTGYARKCVEERDKGVCVECGVDAEKLRRSVNVFESWERANPYPWGGNMSKREAEEAKQVWRQRRMLARARLDVEHQLLVQKGWPKDVDRSWWEMDHILEVVNGGGGCGLDNLQTLCVPCHKGKTNKLLRRCDRVDKRA